jgi:lysozyme family protein
MSSALRLNSARYKAVLKVVLDHEGGFVNDVSDPGGATNKGVSLRWLRSVGDLDGDGFLDGDLNRDGYVDIKDIRMITEEMAGRFYFEHWWEKRRYDLLPKPVGEKVFDMAVNMGSKQAEKLLQRAANTLLPAHQRLEEDGVAGPDTRRLVATLDPRALTNAMCDAQAAFYLSLIRQRPAFNKYRGGWLSRARTYHS